MTAAGTDDASWAMLAALGNRSAINRFWAVSEPVAPHLFPRRDRLVGDSHLVYTNPYLPEVVGNVHGSIVDDQVLHGRTPETRYTVRVHPVTHTIITGQDRPAYALDPDGSTILGYFPTTQTALAALTALHQSETSGRSTRHWMWEQPEQQ